MTSSQLLHTYKQLWSNRSFANEHDSNSGDVLYQAIEKDLLDEMTHPRVRKPPHIKYQWAIKRILDSTLTSDEKLALIEEYTNIYETFIIKKS
ncbi:hypothetical protein [Bacillus sp. CGMCC 1.16541]|uniref:hypothetical protein n=1 Tax=Bacillus sp. CGMCC 1.16541 TaxID=2185143 RepID=UPI000D7371CA|nr:hypothetical protein [Bacillus sp. CGMCC 1.16541]